jgi:hypothetical protein
VPDIEERLKVWQALEQEALRAEARLQGLQAANTPEFAAAVREAADKRKAADRFIDQLLGRSEPAD